MHGTQLSGEKKDRIAGELLDFLLEECEVELSRFRGGMVVDFVAERISAEVYNNAVLDARAFLTERLEDMEEALYAPEPRR